MTQPTLPLIHLNGNSKKQLMDDYHQAWRKVEDAIQSLKLVDCHPRNYYPKGSEAWESAKKEHEECFLKLTEVKKYLQDVEMGIYKQE